MGGDKPWPQVPVGNKDHVQSAVVIIGAGISGICMAIDLIRKNNCKNFVILERSGGLGGTWRDNKYPGCCCDVWSLLYSFSFEQNADWSRWYPGQEEILQYLVRVAEKYSLYQHIRFNSAVDSARWDEQEKKWKVSVKVEGGKDSEFGSEYTLTSDFLVSAVGQLNAPSMPKIPGLDDFRGKKMHTARWDWSYDLRGKRIGIIGSGATAVQIVPEVVKVAKQVTVFQRTPNWVIPRQDSDVASWQQALFRWLPFTQHRMRALMMDFRESSHVAVTDANSDFSGLFRSLCKEAMKRDLPNQPELWKKLTPNYSPGCKRTLISDDFYPSLARDNCTLETGKIERITENGVLMEDGEEEEYDLLVLATGFKTVEFMHPIEIYGRNGRPFSKIWKGGAQALYGVTVDDAPNFGMFYGPNTNLGHSSIILMIESQSRYLNTLVGKVLEARRAGKSLVFTPKHARVAGWNAEAQEILNKTSFADPNCSSWYKNAEGRITNNWYGTVIDYQKLLSTVDWADYEIDGEHRAKVIGLKPQSIGRVKEETQVGNLTLALSALSAAAVVGTVLSGKVDVKKILSVR